MRAADLSTANAIVKRLAKIAAIKAAGPDHSQEVQFLVRLPGGNGEWVPMSKAGRARAWDILVAEFDAETAALRRRAAQISLSL